MKKTILVLVASLLFSSCASASDGDSEQANTDTSGSIVPAVFDDAFAKGKVIDTVTCRYDKTQSYAFYLPSYYKPGRQYPCLLFFDAHDRGSLPVYAYKQLAEKYGFVIAGSNISRNGVSQSLTENTTRKFMDDVRNRISIDPARLYVSGFSGGARVAAGMAMSDGNVAGVIGCSAGFPDGVNGQRKFDYVAIAGDYDINWIEMQELNKQLQQNGYTHQLLTFNGIHSWPPAVEMTTAILWLQVNAMKQKTQSVNDTLINTLKKDYARRIATTKDILKQYCLLNGMVQVLEGLTDVAMFKKQLTALSNSPGYKDALAQQEQLIKEQQQQQQEMSKQFPNQNVKWWTDKIAGMNAGIQSAKTQPRVAEMHQRVLNYLGMICYIYTDRAIKQGELSKAADYLTIFKKADPKNPDVSYLSALLNMKQANNTAANAALKEAARSGYNNVADVFLEPAFQPLYNEAGFKQAIASMKENLKK